MKTTLFRRKISLLTALCTALSLALCCAGCGGADAGTGGTGGMGASAASMFLRKTEGAVAVADSEGQSVEPAENLGLYSGYAVNTEAASYAWIDLDTVKLAKLDESSEAAITRDEGGKSLTVEVKTGSLFFNVTEPLAEDETMEIHTSSMLVGIRGTCGWVEAPGSGTARVFILEGRVECAAGENTAAVNAGEMAELAADGEINVLAFTGQDVPDFVAKEISADETLRKIWEALPKAPLNGMPEESQDGQMLHTAGVELDAGSLQRYESFLRYLNENRAEEVVCAELVDFEADGSPELLVVKQFDTDSPMLSGLQFAVYRCEEDTFRQLAFEMVTGTTGLQDASCSLVQRDGRLFVQCLSNAFNPDTGQRDHWFEYYGLAAGHDGGPDDWVMTDRFLVLELPDATRVMLVSAHNAGGYVDDDTINENEQINDAGEQEALLGQYTLVRELYRRPVTA